MGDSLNETSVLDMNGDQAGRYGVVVAIQLRVVVSAPTRRDAMDDALVLVRDLQEAIAERKALTQDQVEMVSEAIRTIEAVARVDDQVGELS